MNVYLLSRNLCDALQSWAAVSESRLDVGLSSIKTGHSMSNKGGEGQILQTGQQRRCRRLSGNPWILSGFVDHGTKLQPWFLDQNDALVHR